MDSFITTFHIDYKILIAQAINFGIIFIILYFFALKPLGKLMRERQSKIEGGLTDAKQANELIEKTKKEYADVLAKARTEANDIFQAGKADAQNTARETLEKTGLEVESMIASGKRALEAEKVKMIDEAKKEIVSLVVKATEKLLESEADDAFDGKTIKQIKKM